MKFLQSIFKTKPKSVHFEEEPPERKQARELYTKKYLYMLALQLDRNRKKNENP